MVVVIPFFNPADGRARDLQRARERGSIRCKSFIQGQGRPPSSAMPRFVVGGGDDHDVKGRAARGKRRSVPDSVVRETRVSPPEITVLRERVPSLRREIMKGSASRWANQSPIEEEVIRRADSSEDEVLGDEGIEKVRSETEAAFAAMRGAIGRLREITAGAGRVGGERLVPEATDQALGRLGPSAGTRVRRQSEYIRAIERSLSNLFRIGMILAHENSDEAQLWAGQVRAGVSGLMRRAREIQRREGTASEYSEYSDSGDEYSERELFGDWEVAECPASPEDALARIEETIGELDQIIEELASTPSEKRTWKAEIRGGVRWMSSRCFHWDEESSD
jgi:hypothetical protein